MATASIIPRVSCEDTRMPWNQLSITVNAGNKTAIHNVVLPNRVSSVESPETVTNQTCAKGVEAMNNRIALVPIANWNANRRNATK